MSADIIAWLRSEEGEAWSRSRAAYQPTTSPPCLYRQGPGDVAEDPAGRPPVKGPALIAATGEAT